MTHTIVIPSKMASKNVDAWVRPALAQQNMDNGYMFSLTANEVTSGCEVWTVTVPTTASLTDLWMALEPVRPFLASGTNVYQGLGIASDFYISASQVFTAVKVKKGDIITVTSDFFTSGTVPTNGQFAGPTNGIFTPTAGATVAGAGWKFLGYTTIPSADGTIGSGRLTAYKLECIVE